MEIRLLLAFILMGAVMFLTPYFFKSTPPPAREEDHGRGARPRRRCKPFSRRRRRKAARGGDPGGHGGNPRRYPPAASAALHRRYRFLPHRLQQPGRDGAKLGAQEVQGQRRQAARSGQRRVGSGVPVFALLPRRAAHRQGQLGLLPADPRSRWPGRPLRVLRRPHRGPQNLPFQEEQLSLAKSPAK